MGGWGNTAISKPWDNNLIYQNRIRAGEAMGFAQAEDIYNNLEKEESVNIVTHSMGTAYS